MERRDLYDKDRNLLGKTILKGEMPPEGTFIVVVLVFIQNKDGKFLMQKRSVQKERKICDYRWTSKDWRIKH